MCGRSAINVRLELWIEGLIIVYERLHSKSVGLCSRMECRGWTAKANRCGVLWEKWVDEAGLLISLNVRKGPNERIHFAH